MTSTSPEQAAETADNPQIAADFPTVLVVDFGAQYAQLIARRVREADVYSEVVPHTLSAEEILARNPAALILSGGPSSVYSEDAPRLDPALLEAGVPVLGLCYGFQSIAQALGGTVARTGSREYGSTRLEAIDSTCTLFAGQDVDQVVWMSHGDAVTDAPEGFAVTASTPGAPVAAFEDPQRRIFGVQWHPEVGHSQYGQRVIERFLREGAGLDRSWTTANVIEEQVALIREQIGQHRAICGLSGGVDSAVAAALVQRAVGDQLTCVYVNHGLMRQDESEEIEKAFGKATGGARLVMVDAEDVFLEALAGVTDPETKRKIIGEKFIRTFEKAQADIVAESRNDPNAQDVKFLVQGTLYPDVVESGGGAGLDRSWTTANVIEEQVALIREQIGQHRAICGLSGGVDSAVAAALVQRAVGDQLTCVYVNHGLMRQDESEEIEKAFGKATGGARLVMVDAEDVFLEALAGVTDPETKRKIIGEKFIRTFEKAQADIVAESRNDPNAQDVKFLVQGTLYPDVVESGGGEGTANIKSHHNVGGLPEDIEFELCEPLRALFKDEVRAVGAQLGLPEEIVQRQPFPGPGLGIRIIGEVTKERLDLLRQADAIVRAELTSAGLDREIWQCPVVLLADVRSVGVQGDGRTYGHPVVLRPVTSEDAMTADWAKVPYDVLSRISNRITNEVDGINRVVLDVTSKPPGTIEWE